MCSLYTVLVYIYRSAVSDTVTSIGIELFHEELNISQCPLCPSAFIPVCSEDKNNTCGEKLKCQDEGFRRCWNCRRGPVWQPKTAKIVAAVTAGLSAILSLPVEGSIKHVLEKIFYAKTHPRCHQTVHLKWSCGGGEGSMCYMQNLSQLVKEEVKPWGKKLSHSRREDIKESSSCKEDVHDVRNVCTVS